MLLVPHGVDEAFEFAVVGFALGGLGLPRVVHVGELLFDLALGDLLPGLAAFRRGSADDDGESHGFVVLVVFLVIFHQESS